MMVFWGDVYVAKRIERRGILFGQFTKALGVAEDQEWWTRRTAVSAKPIAEMVMPEGVFDEMDRGRFQERENWTHARHDLLAQAFG